MRLKVGRFHKKRRICGYGIRQGYGKGNEREEERKGIIRAGYITNHIWVLIQKCCNPDWD